MKTKRLIGIIMVLFSGLLFGSQTSAATDVLTDVAMLQTSSHLFVGDTARNNIYIFDRAQNDLHVDNIPLLGQPTDIQIYKNYILVALQDVKAIQVFRLDTFASVGSIPTPKNPFAIAVNDAQNYAFVSTARRDTTNIGYEPFLIQFDLVNILNSQTTIPSWPDYPDTLITVSGDDLIVLDPADEDLFLMNSGISPATLHQLDISDINKPILVAQNNSFGGNGEDLYINPGANEIIVGAKGATNNGVPLFKTNPLSLQSVLPFGLYPNAVHGDGQYYYAGKTGSQPSGVSVFRQGTNELIGSYDFPVYHQLLSRGLNGAYAVTNLALYKINLTNNSLDLKYVFSESAYLYTDIKIIGNGKVELSSGAECTDNCHLGFAEAKPVTFTAIPDQGFKFAYWKWACAPSTNSNSCELTMDKEHYIEAVFEPAQELFTLTVKKDGTGQGKVTSSTGGVDCGGACSVQIPAGTVVSLYVWPEPYSDFRLWTGEDCLGTIGTAVCNVTMDKDQTVTATFNKSVSQIKYDVDVTDFKLEVLSDSSVSLSWNTDPSLNCAVVYSQDSQLKDDVIDPTVKKTIVPVYRERSYIAGGLEARALYYFTVVCRDHASNDKKAQSYIASETTLFTKPAPENPIDNTTESNPNPIVSSVSTKADSYQAVITWKTDIPATSHILYGLKPDFDQLNKSVRSEVLATEHRVILRDLQPLTLYYFKLEGKSRAEVFYSSNIGEFKTIEDDSSDSNLPVEPAREITLEEELIMERIQKLSYRVTELEREIVILEKQLVQTVDENLVEQVEGKILLQVEENGEAWFVDKITKKKFYLRNGDSAYAALQAFGLGITNEDLRKIPIGYDPRFEGLDSDGDKLPDKLEEALGLDPFSQDSDGDGFLDVTEVQHGFDPLGPGRLNTNQLFADGLEGRIVLQVESNGEAWYIHDGKRYYLGNGEQAYQIMRFLSLGITNENLRKILVGEFAS